MKDSNLKPSFLNLSFAYCLGMIFTAAMVLSMGCAMCCGPYDYHYPSIGGKHERVDPTYGRVGSVFSDPMAMPLGESADSNLDRDESYDRRPGMREGRDSEDAEGIRRRLEEELDQRRRPQVEELPGPDEMTRRDQFLRWQQARQPVRSR